MATNLLFGSESATWGAWGAGVGVMLAKGFFRLDLKFVYVSDWFTVF